MASPSDIKSNRASGDALDVKAFGSPVPRGVITSTAGESVNNHTTAAPFFDTGVGLGGRTLLICPSTSGRVLACEANDGTTTLTMGQTNTGVPLAAEERAEMQLGETQGWIAWIPTSAEESHLEVWEMF